MSTLSNIFLFSLIFISVQKDIMVCTNINKLIFFSNVIKSVRPTYGNKEELASLTEQSSFTSLLSLTHPIVQSAGCFS